jgi:DNA transposition AAA+ family ATPase
MVKTNSLKIISNLFDDVQKNSRMVGLTATPGNGKSTLIDECCKNDYKRIPVNMGKSKKAKHVYQDIYRRLRPSARSVPNDMYDLIHESAKFLSTAEKKYLVVLDESGKFKPATLELFHEFRDLTREKCGFVFAGPPYWKENLTSWVEEQKQGMEEFARRFDEWVALDNPTPSEKSQYCKDRGIHEITLIEQLSNSSETFSDLVTAVDEYFRKK